ncbi:acetyl-CoA carboxylase, carboxyltransferase subunit beta [uncultured Paludibaculum sp.]|uniref:acetyl-CoA carboxylase, carboxyltransferase subunit beta n=1 Tax=uncultured Paludibaculum sp. TaxID=1765020 RepID=UPI002AAB7A18|nr:acetyl-CoA carboxylase, carboxyltransferase subunit beta [uncultured Paludibaculum sp.]
MDWFKLQKKVTAVRSEEERHIRTEGLWIKCDGCRQIIWRKDLEETLQCCPKCGHHFRIDARTRLNYLLDGGVWQEHDAGMTSSDPLEFVDSKPYRDRLAGMQKSTGMKDAVISATGKIQGRQVHVCAMELKFIGGSMGAVVGEKMTRMIERSIADKSPCIIVSASGGARMQEGAISLMQMAKISSALMKLDEAKIPYISLLTDPTTGGVTASFAMLGDLNIAEPGAQIGFAGPRVIEQTIRQKLPAGFQRSEFVLQHGFLDAVVKRSELRVFIARSLDFFCGPLAA